MKGSWKKLVQTNLNLLLEGLHIINYLIQHHRLTCYLYTSGVTVQKTKCERF